MASSAMRGALRQLRSLILPLAVIFLVTPGTGCSAQDERSDAIAAESAAPRPLMQFNGKDLTGFYPFLRGIGRADPDRVFSVTPDDLLRISGDGLGYLSTDRSFRDYHLIVEFKWGDRDWRDREGKAKDSGIFLHSAGPDGNSYDGGGAYKAAIECQIMQGAVGDLLLINGKDKDGQPLPIRISARVAPLRDDDGWYWWRADGDIITLDRGGRLNWAGKSDAWRDELNFRGRADVESPAGQWTRIECTCHADRITIRVNGRIVNEAFDVRPQEGPILLQCEGSEIFFRRFEIHPLKHPPRHD